MHILGIESSCDETSVSVIDDGGQVLSNLIASQVARHQPFGGVVPEIASREHLQHLMPLVRQAADDSKVPLEKIGAIAVTAGPGLIGALLVGVAGAQGLSYGLGIPLITVNHLEGHIFSPYLRATGEAVELPARFLSLVVSGGHSSVYDVRTSARGSIVKMLNRTRDDAAGEIFDKVAKFIGLPYPGGPHVERVASGGDAAAFDFPLAQFKVDSIDFSFSGLKSTAIRLARKEKISAEDESSPMLKNFCAGFQKAICDQIEDRLSRVWDEVGRAGAAPTELALAGGVAANGALRERIRAWGEKRGLVVRLPEKRFCTDNAAMIAFAGLQKFRAGEIADARRVVASSRVQTGV